MRTLASSRSPTNSQHLRFTGSIAGSDTASGHRLVIGYWLVSPFGSVTDILLEDPDGPIAPALPHPHPSCGNAIADALALRAN